jgi:hypothetical protein
MVNATVLVSEGTANADTQWTCTTNGPITLGSTSLAFAQVSGGSSQSADESTLHLSGSTYSIKTSGVGNAQLRDSAGLAIIGRSANSTGAVADIVAANDKEVLRRSGTSIGFGTIHADAVGAGVLAIARLATGTPDGTKFVKDDGTLAVPPGSTAGSLILLEQHTASSSATLDFTTCITSTYDVYEIVFMNVVPATDNVSFYMRMSTDGGATYASGGSDYYYSYIANATATLSGSGAVAAQLQLANSVNTASGRSINGTYRLYNPGGALHKSLAGHLNAAAASGQYEFTGGGLYLSTTAVNAFRFLMSSGNVASGTIRVYGVAK